MKVRGKLEVKGGEMTIYLYKIDGDRVVDQFKETISLNIEHPHELQNYLDGCIEASDNDVDHLVNIFITERVVASIRDHFHKTKCSECDGCKIDTECN